MAKQVSARKTVFSAEISFESMFHLKKSLTVPKKLKEDPLVSPGFVCYAEKEEKHFWFSSLGQIM